MRLLSGVLVLLVLLGRTLARPAVCPERQIVMKVNCRCEPGPVYRCDEPEELWKTKELATVLQLKAVPVKRLQLRWVTVFPSSVCEANIEEITVVDSHIKDWGDLRACNSTAFTLKNVTFDWPQNIFRTQGQLPNLREMTFSNMRVNMSEISQWTELTSLVFRWCEVIIEGDIPQRNLKTLKFMAVNFSDEAIWHRIRVLSHDLEEFAISGSNLEEFPSHILSEMPHLKLVDITMNRLRSLDATSLIGFHGVLRMQGNPWDCGTLYWLRKRQKERSIEIFNPFLVRCSHPEGLTFDKIQLKHKIGTAESWRIPPTEPQEASHTKPKKAPQEAPQRAPQEAPQEPPQRAPQKTPQEAPQRAPQTPPQEVPQETPQEAPQRTPQEAPQRTPQEAPKPTHNTYMYVPPAIFAVSLLGILCLTCL